ncbi:hypothetical protein MIMGU_mgv11b021470mg [Erythranthe guttata]|uniref:DNA helicase Pif1-like 2B domain-containing protein n=1 Tax=Erythranthe guttata TaxID=4155 RepID=A0A022RBE6_ERYGU|nr:hypothetical protein MIMGU_mgv11b021470mg [Erythranthe guttata]
MNLFGGNFRQNLPIVLGGSRDSMIAASIDCSVIWLNVTKIRLTLREYVSYNWTIDSNQKGEYEDYLNSILVSGLPPHILRLEKNCPIMLFSNLVFLKGLCNGTRLI